MRRREIWLPDKVDDMALALAKAKGVEVSVLYSGLLSDRLLGDHEEKSENVEPRSSNPSFSSRESSPYSPTSESKEVYGFVQETYEPDLDPVYWDKGYFERAGRGKGEYIITHWLADDPVFEKVDPGHGDWSMTCGFSHRPGRFVVSDRFSGFPQRSIQYAQRIVSEAIKIPGVIPSDYGQKNGRKTGIAFKPNFLMIEALLQRKSGVRVSLYGRPHRFTSPPADLRPGRGTYSRIVVDDDEELEQFLPLIRQAYELKLGPVPVEQPSRAVDLGGDI